MSTYENGEFVPWHPEMIASKGSVLHGRNSAFVSPMIPSRDPKETHFAAHTRAVRLLIWAAKCHTHSQTTGLPLGNLAHSVEEVNAAIARIEEISAFRLPRHEDEGVKVRSKRVH